MALYEENLYEDLADEAEGAADAFDDGFEEYDEFDEADEADEFDEADELEASGLDAGDEFDEGDAAEMEAADLGDEDIDAYEDVDSFEGDEDAFEAGMAYALAAEDTDEFFRRIGRFIRRAAPVVGRIARAAAPILRVIPHPIAQGAATAANLLGRLRFEGASEDEALEAMAELAARNPRVIPVVAGLAARTLVRRAGAAMPTAARRAAVRAVARAAQTLVRSGGPAGIRALPRVVRSVQRTAATRRTPPAVRPRVALNTARRVAASPRLARRLSRPLPRGRALVRRAVAGGRALRPGMRGPMMRGMRGAMMRGAGMRGLGWPRRSFVYRGVRITATPA
jgi:hypothetical protein